MVTILAYEQTMYVLRTTQTYIGNIEFQVNVSHTRDDCTRISVAQQLHKSLYVEHLPFISQAAPLLIFFELSLPECGVVWQ